MQEKQGDYQVTMIFDMDDDVDDVDVELEADAVDDDDDDEAELLIEYEDMEEKRLLPDM